MPTGMEEHLLEEARRHAARMGIAPEEFLRNCLEISQRMLREAPAMLENFARTAAEIEASHRELEARNLRGARRTNGTGKIFL